MTRDRTMKKRRRLARALERASIPERPFLGRARRGLVHPDVASACADALRALAASARDESFAIADDDLAAVWTFISDGASPFFGRHPSEAAGEAVRLQHRLLSAKPTAASSRMFATERSKEMKDGARKIVSAAALALVVALLAIPSAFGGATNPGTCPCNAGLPVAQQVSAATPLAAGIVGCPCNAGLPIERQLSNASPATVRIVRVTDSNGFNWNDFAIGVAAAAGGMIALAGLGVGLRQARRPLRSA